MGPEEIKNERDVITPETLGVGVIKPTQSNLVSNLQSELLDTDPIINAILEELKSKHVKEKDAKIKLDEDGKETYEGKRVTIKLGNDKFDYFVSNDKVMKEEFKDKLEEKSKSIEDVSKLLQAINKYMAEKLKGKVDIEKLKGKIDIEKPELEYDGNSNFDYEKKLKYWNERKIGCKAGYYLKKITGLDVNCWLKDSGVNFIKGKKNSQAVWFFSGDYCNFLRTDVKNSVSTKFNILLDWSKIGESKKRTL